MNDSKFYIGQNALNNKVWCVSIDGVAIYNPFYSECGRFKVEPQKYYGLSKKDIKKLIDLNKSSKFEWEIV